MQAGTLVAGLKRQGELTTDLRRQRMIEQCGGRLSTNWMMTDRMEAGLEQTGQRQNKSVTGRNNPEHDQSVKLVRIQ